MQNDIFGRYFFSNKTGHFDTSRPDFCRDRTLNDHFLNSSNQKQNHCLKQATIIKVISNLLSTKNHQFLKLKAVISFEVEVIPIRNIK